MIKGEEAKSIFNYIDSENKKYNSKIKISEDGIWEVRYKKEKTSYYDELDILIKIINKKTYKNSNNEEFEVYMIKKYIKSKLTSLFYVIKISNDKFIGLKNNVGNGSHVVLSKQGRAVLSKDTVRELNEEIKKITKGDLTDIIMKLCEEIDIFFKNKLKYLVNPREKEKAYFYVKRVLEN